MSLHVVKSAFKDHKFVVTLTSDNPDMSLAISELQDPAAKKKALIEASEKGIANGAMSSINVAAYPVGEDGEPLKSFGDRIARYQADIEIRPAGLGL